MGRLEVNLTVLSCLYRFSDLFILCSCPFKLFEDHPRVILYHLKFYLYLRPVPISCAIYSLLIKVPLWPGVLAHNNFQDIRKNRKKNRRNCLMSVKWVCSTAYCGTVMTVRDFSLSAPHYAYRDSIHLPSFVPLTE